VIIDLILQLTKTTNR